MAKLWLLLAAWVAVIHAFSTKTTKFISPTALSVISPRPPTLAPPRHLFSSVASNDEEVVEQKTSQWLQKLTTTLKQALVEHVGRSSLLPLESSLQEHWERLSTSMPALTDLDRVWRDAQDRHAERGMDLTIFDELVEDWKSLTIDTDTEPVVQLKNLAAGHGRRLMQVSEGMVQPVPIDVVQANVAIALTTSVVTGHNPLPAAAAVGVVSVSHGYLGELSRHVGSWISDFSQTVWKRLKASLDEKTTMEAPMTAQAATTEATDATLLDPQLQQQIDQALAAAEVELERRSEADKVDETLLSQIDVALAAARHELERIETEEKEQATALQQQQEATRMEMAEQQAQRVAAQAMDDLRQRLPTHRDLVEPVSLDNLAHQAIDDLRQTMPAMEETARVAWRAYEEKEVSQQEIARARRQERVARGLLAERFRMERAHKERSELYMKTEQQVRMKTQQAFEHIQKKIDARHAEQKVTEARVRMETQLAFERIETEEQIKLSQNLAKNEQLSRALLEERLRLDNEARMLKEQRAKTARLRHAVLKSIEEETVQERERFRAKRAELERETRRVVDRVQAADKARREAQEKARAEEAARREAQSILVKEKVKREEEARANALRVKAEEEAKAAQERARLEAERIKEEEKARYIAELQAQKKDEERLEAARIEAEEQAKKEERARLEAARVRAEAEAKAQQEARLEAARVKAEEDTRLAKETKSNLEKEARLDAEWVKTKEEAKAKEAARIEAKRIEAIRVNALAQARLEATKELAEQQARLVEERAQIEAAKRRVAAQKSAHQYSFTSMPPKKSQKTGPSAPTAFMSRRHNLTDDEKRDNMHFAQQLMEAEELRMRQRLQQEEHKYKELEETFFNQLEEATGASGSSNGGGSGADSEPSTSGVVASTVTTNRPPVSSYALLPKYAKPNNTPVMLQRTKKRFEEPLLA